MSRIVVGPLQINGTIFTWSTGGWLPRQPGSIYTVDLGIRMHIFTRWACLTTDRYTALYPEPQSTRTQIYVGLCASATASSGQWGLHGRLLWPAPVSQAAPITPPCQVRLKLASHCAVFAMISYDYLRYIRLTIVYNCDTTRKFWTCSKPYDTDTRILSHGADTPQHRVIT